MESGGFRILLIALLLIVAGVVFLWFQPTIEERLAPELERAWVAIELDGSGIAEIGPVAIEAGTPFTLHAVLEGTRRDGPIYYTRAPALRFAGEAEPVTAPVRRWDRAPRVEVRWFTVEGSRPYLALENEAALDDFAFQTFFRADWPSTWTVPGTVDAASDDHLDGDQRAELGLAQRFGTQRYHVRIELYADDETVIPFERFASWGPAALPAEVARFPTVVASLPGALAPASRVFGLTQLDPPPDAPTSMLIALRELAARGLAFSRLTVLRDQLRIGGELDRLRWRSLDLGASPAWGDTVRPGDLLRVGERAVVLFQDRGDDGRLDYDDLCFDFVRGAAIRRLGTVFSGEGLVVEHYPVAADEEGARTP